MEKRLSISSEIKNLHKVEKLIDEISAEYNLKSEVYGNILISTIEAANNAITHGNKMNKNKNVEIAIHIDENKLKICIEDEGTGFDYNLIPDPTKDENIEKVNGRGIFIMGKLADELNYANNGKKIELTFKI